MCNELSPRKLAFASRGYSATPQQTLDQGSGTEQPLMENPEQMTQNEEPLNEMAALPWYLQMKTPQRVTSPLADRQRLPDLPPNPPPLLQPMLEHISVELGLDDLSLLDLRNLDPPPALGSNLLMVLGTARSEKHLHVSADRFCRWLRTEYKLSPFADGLLGRGELKLKMRRKARRAKILSRVGSTETGNTDDGIRTGWVCVNVGAVEDGITSPDNDSSLEGYVGFGADTEGVKIVIQMLTGEKREELELERLWGQALARQDRRRERIDRGEKEAAEVLEAEVGTTPWSKSSFAEFPFLHSSCSENHSNRPLQTRSFRSNARL